MNPIELSVAEYTTPGPYAVGPKEPLANAKRLMDKYGIRELPVRAEGKPVGVLSRHVVQIVAALDQAHPESLAVEDVMTSDPYAVDLETPLDEVVRGMAARKVDVAVVLREGGIVGVFTSADALGALADLLEGKLARADKHTGASPPRPSRGHKGRATR